MHFRDELGHFAVLEEKPINLLSALGIDIPFAANVIDGGEHLIFRVEFVQAHQRRVGADQRSVEGGPENAFGDVVVEIAKASLDRRQSPQRAVAIEREAREAEAGKSKNDKKACHDDRFAGPQQRARNEGIHGSRALPATELSESRTVEEVPTASIVQPLNSGGNTGTLARDLEKDD
jgi:hypothetical protein